MLTVPSDDLRCGGDGLAGYLKLVAGEVVIGKKRWRAARWFDRLMSKLNVSK